MRKGFTLIEVVVSVAILIGVLFGTSELFARGVDAARQAEKLTVAVNLAQAEIETVLSLQYGELTIGTFEARHFVFSSYERMTTVNYIDPNSFAVVSNNTGLKKITTTIFYPLPKTTKSYALSVLVTDK